MRRSALVLALMVIVVAGPAVTAARAEHTEFFAIVVRANSDSVGNFDYRYNLPSGAGWLDGDRVAYRCAFMFLQSGGELVFRVTFTRIAEYAVINDTYMHEGVRNFDGSPNPSGGQTDFCPEPAEAYVPLEGDPGPLPVITIADISTGLPLEIRNYANVEEVGPGVQFKIQSATPDRVTVLLYQDGLPVTAVYYDRLSDAVSLTSNFTQPPPPPPPPPPPVEPISIQIARIAFDPAGTDTGRNPSLNKEFVVVRNTGATEVALIGWTLRDRSGNTFTFPEFTLSAGASVKIHTGSGAGTITDLYWGSNRYVWNNRGDRATLRDAEGVKQDTCRYSGARGSGKC